MKLNEEQSHLLIFGAKNYGVTLNIDASQRHQSDSESEKFLGVTLDSKLYFNAHIDQLL